LRVLLGERRAHAHPLDGVTGDLDDDDFIRRSLLREQGGIRL
jgi:hypothetical protein